MDCRLANINWNKVTPYLFLLMLDAVLDFSDCATHAEVNKHLELGRDFLARGQFSDALTHYHAAVEGDPNNYLTYFKRGTVYYALGKAKFALQDFTKVLEIKPDFTAAQLQRANVYLKLGEYTKAREDLEHVISVEPYNKEALSQYSLLDNLIENMSLCEAYYRGRDFSAAIELGTALLETSPWSVALRQLRAEAYIATNDLYSAVSDLRTVNRLQQDSTDGYFRLSTLLYTLGHVSDALKEVRECLRLDPEHKKCFPLYKKVKQVDKLLQQCEESAKNSEYASCIEYSRKLLKLEEDSESMVTLEGRKWLCACAVKDEQYSAALSYCNEALQIHEDPTILCDKADALLGLEMYDDAIRAYKEALNIDDKHNRAKEGLSRAQHLQKHAEQRDYYKILGVKRSANKQQIVKAYRKAAQKWHPDNFTGDEKKIAEKKFIDIAAAKEVLTDPEKRAQFDSGVDPLDPEQSRHQQYQNPFHHFQHGSPFQFKFHFN